MTIKEERIDWRYGVEKRMEHVDNAQGMSNGGSLEQLLRVIHEST
jgi:hypothetical protein